MPRRRLSWLSPICRQVVGQRCPGLLMTWAVPNPYKVPVVKREHPPRPPLRCDQQRRGFAGGDESLGRSALAITPRCRLAGATGGCTQHVSGLRRHRPRGVGRLCRGEGARPGPMLMRSRGPGHSRRLAHPANGMSRWWRLGGGADADRSRPPAAAVGGGEWDDPPGSSPMGWPAPAARTLGTGREAVSPFDAPPSSDAAGSSGTRSHGSPPPRGVLRTYGTGRRPVPPAGCPRPCPDAPAGLAVHRYSCVVRARACGSR